MLKPSLHFSPPRSLLMSVIILLTGCARNIYQIPHSVQPIAQKAVEALKTDQGTLFVILDGKNPDYELLFSKCPSSNKQHIRLIRHSGHWVEIGGKRYHLVMESDYDLSNLILKKGEEHSFSGRFRFFHGPWVKWSEAEVTDSWLAPRWQPKSDSLQPKQ